MESILLRTEDEKLEELEESRLQVEQARLRVLQAAHAVKTQLSLNPSKVVKVMILKALRLTEQFRLNTIRLAKQMGLPDGPFDLSDQDCAFIAKVLSTLQHPNAQKRFELLNSHWTAAAIESATTPAAAQALIEEYAPISDTASTTLLRLNRGYTTLLRRDQTVIKRGDRSSFEKVAQPLAKATQAWFHDVIPTASEMCSYFELSARGVEHSSQSSLPTPTRSPTIPQLNTSSHKISRDILIRAETFKEAPEFDDAESIAKVKDVDRPEKLDFSRKDDSISRSQAGSSVRRKMSPLFQGGSLIEPRQKSNSDLSTDDDDDDSSEQDDSEEDDDGDDNEVTDLSEIISGDDDDDDGDDGDDGDEADALSEGAVEDHAMEVETTDLPSRVRENDREQVDVIKHEEHVHDPSNYIEEDEMSSCTQPAVAPAPTKWLSKLQRAALANTNKLREAFAHTTTTTTSTTPNSSIITPSRLSGTIQTIAASTRLNKPPTQSVEAVSSIQTKSRSHRGDSSSSVLAKKGRRRTIAQSDPPRPVGRSTASASNPASTVPIVPPTLESTSALEPRPAEDPSSIESNNSCQAPQPAQLVPIPIPTSSAPSIPPPLVVPVSSSTTNDYNTQSITSSEWQSLTQPAPPTKKDDNDSLNTDSLEYVDFVGVSNLVSERREEEEREKMQVTTEEAVIDPVLEDGPMASLGEESSAVFDVAMHRNFKQLTEEATPGPEDEEAMNDVVGGMRISPFF